MGELRVEYKEFLRDAYINGQLSTKGLNNYISLLKGEIIDLKQKVIDLKFEIRKGTQEVN